MAVGIITHKICARCKTTKPSNEFHRNISKHDGLGNYCGICENAYYRSRHPYDVLTNLPNEIWKPIPEFDGIYAVSNLARVKRMVVGIGARAGRERKQQVNRAGRGYMTVNLPYKGKRYTCMVHRLVALAFLDDPQPGLDINHKDGDTRNNRLDNLEFATKKQNSEHARKVLKVGARKLTESIVIQIRQRASVGERHKDIAADLALNQSTVTRIVNRISWAHV